MLVVRDDGAKRPLLTWTADGRRSRSSLARFAATLRESNEWSKYPLVVPGGEWGEEGATPAVLIETGFGKMIIKSKSRNRVYLSIHLRREQGLFSATGYIISQDEAVRFGSELAAELEKFEFAKVQMANIASCEI